VKRRLCCAAACGLATLGASQHARATGFNEVGDDYVPREKTSVELDGYFRTRGEALYDMDLNRGLTPSHFDRFLAKLDAPELRHLDLSGRPVGPKAVRKLTDPKFAALARLGLRGCKLTNPAVAALIAAPALRNLVQLELDDNRLTTGPEALADPSLLPRLGACSLTANAFPEDRERCFEAGMDDFLAKPVEAEELYRVLARFLPLAS